MKKGLCVLGFLVGFSFSQWSWDWHAEKVYRYRAYAGKKNIMLNSQGYPLIVFDEKWVSNKVIVHQWVCVWWNGSNWETDTFPLWMAAEESGESNYAWLMGEDDRLWFVIAEDDTTLPPGPLGYPQRYRFYHGFGDIWDSLPSLSDTFSYELINAVLSPIPVYLDTTGLPVFANARWMGSDEGIGIHRFNGSAWQSEFVPCTSSTGALYHIEARGDNEGNVHISGTAVTSLFHLSNETGSWLRIVLYNLGGTGDLFWSVSGLYIDRWRQVYLFSNPYIYGTGFVLRYAFRDLDGFWHMEDVPLNYPLGYASNHVADSNGVCHFAYTFDGGVFHWYKYFWGDFWQTNLIAPGKIDLDARSFGIDSFNYLHLCYGTQDSCIYYATTNPKIGASESSPDPRPNLILVPTSHGFYITGYSGPAQIYDPAGRLVLNREIKGKTLIGPLSPGVYFVVAGRGMAKVTVR